MIHLSRIILCKAKRPGSGKGTQNWIDSLRIYCKAGNGGNGTPQYGGLGGNGGSVIIKVPEKTEKPKKKRNAVPTNLTQIFKQNFKSDPKKQRLTCPHGGHSERTRLNGPHGEDVILKVPPGIAVVDDKNNLIADLNTHGQEVCVVKGGQGGNKLNNFIGTRGQTMHVRLDLKLLADIGLVGFPNAGKSTLLNAISNARPKIANYPFTTLRPNLGHLKYEDERVLTMADLPGLIEGSHMNLGLGHHFLKHVERTKMLLFVIDIDGFQLGPAYPKRSAIENVLLLNKELELYNPDLLNKPCLLAVNKMDLPGSRKLFKLFEEEIEKAVLEDESLMPEKRIEFREIIPMSAKEDVSSVHALKDKVRDHIDEVFDEDSGELVKKLTEEIEAVLKVDNKFML